ncbi:hypothetical protein AMECASPLE_009877 [Ameca splendens]|uniref:Secreted protein n=1 Tax=Ameca splendens TaxID=208324 RepID=A0ABV1A6N1_9TELE
MHCHRVGVKIHNTLSTWPVTVHMDRLCVCVCVCVCVQAWTDTQYHNVATNSFRYSTVQSQGILYTQKVWEHRWIFMHKGFLPKRVQFKGENMTKGCHVHLHRWVFFPPLQHSDLRRSDLINYNVERRSNINKDNKKELHHEI